MAMLHSASDDGKLKTFKTFPKFSKLSYGDRKQYENLIKDYPPLADVSFPALMIWWNQLDTCAISALNNNLVIYYNFLGSEEMSGLSLIGTNKIDESICMIFDYLRERNMPVRLVHVPEFVLENIEYPEMFRCIHDRDFDEYIYDISKFYPLNHMISYRRHRVRRFLSEIDENRVILKELDLTQPSERQMLRDHVWPEKGINKLAKAFEDVWTETLDNADLLGLEGVGLYIDKELKAFCIYRQSYDRRYIHFREAKVDYALPYLFDYMVYAFARWFAEKGVQYVNLDSDAGLPFLRMFMVALGPSNYFRKYSIEPMR